MIITISGTPGSGKSTMAKKLVERYKLEYYSMGRVMRDIAKKRGIDFLKLTEIAKKDASVDKEIDKYQKDLGKKDNILVDSRIGFFFIPNSIKIFLKVDEKEAAKRIMKYEREDEKYKDEKEAVKAIKKRMNAEKERYKKYYGINNFRDKKNYDFVLDTTNLSIEEVFERILRFIDNRLQ